MAALEHPKYAGLLPRADCEQLLGVSGKPHDDIPLRSPALPSRATGRQPRKRIPEISYGLLVFGFGYHVQPLDALNPR